MNKSDYIFGMHAVAEALAAGKEIDRIYLKKEMQGEQTAKLLKEARQRHIPVLRVPVERINRITRGTHQGVLAIVSPIGYASVEMLIPQLYEDGKTPLIVVLDGVTDVRNFGAIARTCECAGVDSIIIPERGSVGVTADAVKTSAGALLRIPVCRCSSIPNTLAFLKESGLNVVATSDHAADVYTSADFTVPTAIVMGAEDTGVSIDVQRTCSQYLRIPQKGEINSLNVSVAAGIIIFEAVRQRSLTL